MSIRNKINQDKMFVSNAIIKVPRSTFYRNQKHSTTFDAGKLVPVYVDTVVPGDTMDIDFNAVIRTTSPFIKAPMDDLRADYYAFFVPSRIVWKHFPKMIANYQEDPAQWSTDVDYICPTVNLGVVHTEEDMIDTVADHMGIPPLAVNTASSGFEINRLPFLAYARIWNEWFRDENLQNAIYAPDDLSSGDVANYDPTSIFTTSASVGGVLAPLNKIKDYFTTALPAPQAGEAATLSIGGTAPLGGIAPVGLQVSDSNFFSYNNCDLVNTGSAVGNKISFGNNTDIGVVISDMTSVSGVNAHLYNYDEETAAYQNKPLVANLDNAEEAYADLSQVSGISVNDLRYLVQIQQMKETDARYGRRYKEYLLGHWGVISADARLQLPEFLGHVGFDLNINQTVQTSGTLLSDENATATTPQSNISSYSLTAAANTRICNKSFTEHGYLIIVGGVRVKHRTYAQGVNRMWFRTTRYDFYDPCLANIGEQPVYEAELYADYSNPNENVFGYQEAWANYRYLPNICSGYQRPQISNTLAYWNFADNFTTVPTLSSAFVEEDISSLDRCLAIPSDTVPQFTADFYIKNKATRPMPVHSIPGLVDHSGKIII